MDEEVHTEGMTDSLVIRYRNEQFTQCRCWWLATRHTFGQEPSFGTSQDMPRGAPQAPFCILGEGQQHEIPMKRILPAVTAGFSGWSKETILILLGGLVADVPKNWWQERILTSAISDTLCCNWRLWHVLQKQDYFWWRVASCWCNLKCKPAQCIIIAMRKSISQLECIHISWQTDWPPANASWHLRWCQATLNEEGA